jgi:carbonic anhydrase
MQDKRSLGRRGLAASVAVILMLSGCGRSKPTPTAAPAGPAAPVASKLLSAAPAAADPAWHYEGAEGPAEWGALSPKFAACGEGRSQSPIDFVKPAPGTATRKPTQFPPAELRVAHQAHAADVLNNGHTIQVNYAGGDTLTIGDDKYELAQYHFHNRSEHTVTGTHFPMEMHLVHQAADGRLAVIGVFIEEGAHNAAFDPVWTNLPGHAGVKTHYAAVKVDVDTLLPSTHTSYRYDGSLTTPPCSEGVKWIVMTTPIQLSAQQIAAFTSLIHDNNRPLQPLNGRRVATDAVALQ